MRELAHKAAERQNKATLARFAKHLLAGLLQRGLRAALLGAGFGQQRHPITTVDDGLHMEVSPSIDELGELGLRLLYVLDRHSVEDPCLGKAPLDLFNRGDGPAVLQRVGPVGGVGWTACIGQALHEVARIVEQIDGLLEVVVGSDHAWGIHGPSLVQLRDGIVVGRGGHPREVGPSPAKMLPGAPWRPR